MVSNSLWPHGLQHDRPPCPSPTPRVYSNSCPLSQWCYQTISSYVVPFSSCLQSLPTSGSFLMSQFFASSRQSIGVSASASVLPVNIHDCSLAISIFLKRSLAFPIPLFSTISLHCSLKKAFVSLLGFGGVYLSLSPLPFTSLLFSAIGKASSTTTLPSFISFH